ncbi:MAG: DUF1844 domain-containing protein [Bacteroidetes bacterium]|jgi:hypothetical protein|nr:DUF1844 domain-containing protein [Bacteroidota bacterium]
MDDQRRQALFASLVISLHAAAMQHLGKVKDPATDTVRRDLEQAQMVIDLLDMLTENTKNNLSANESTFLSRTVQELKLNYVDEVVKDQKA